MDKDTQSKFEELQMSRKHKWIIIIINKEKTQIIVEKTSSDKIEGEEGSGEGSGGVEGEYQRFLNAMPSQECRWAVYDLEFSNLEGAKRNKICFFLWCVSTTKPPTNAHFLGLLVGGLMMVWARRRLC